MQPLRGLDLVHVSIERTFTGRKQIVTRLAPDSLMVSGNKLVTRMTKVMGNTSAFRVALLQPREGWSTSSQRREKQPF